MRLHGTKRGGSAPKSAKSALRILARYLKLKDEVWVPGELTAMSKDPAFNHLWRKLRLQCEGCGGYYVLRGRRDRSYKIAGCTNYHSQGCRSTMGSKEYTRAKGDVVIALLLGQPPPRSYFLVESSSRRIKRAGGEQSNGSIP